MKKLPPLTKDYSPLYFLNALGAGGLSVSFFMYLLWMTPHKGLPIPTFFSLTHIFESASFGTQSLALIACLGILLFAFYHFRLLFWNLRCYTAWKKTNNYNLLKKENLETQLMAMPLTLAMSVNVLFILGALFIPHLWENREYLFPLSLLIFSAIGVLGLKIYLDFFVRVLTEGGFDCSKNNNLGQMISVFAFSMIGVGFSAVAAMSHNIYVLSLGFLGALFFITITITLGLIKLTLGFRAMMEHRADEQTTPTLWILIPILTVLGITIYRLKMGLLHHFHVPTSSAEIGVFLVCFMSLQLFFGLIGWLVMKRVDYMKKWIYGKKKSVGAYTLICPGVAFFVLANFVINAGLVKLELITPFSFTYGILYLPLIYIQFITIRLFFKLNTKLL